MVGGEWLEKQHFGGSASCAREIEPGRQHACVIDNEKVTIAQELGEITHALVLRFGCSLVD
jgi:uncharacterized membrane protein